MTLAVRALLALAALACCLADPVPETEIKWCLVSDAEMRKCNQFQAFEKNCRLTCVRRASTHDCIKAIVDFEADAITLDGGHLYDAGLAPYNLRPIMVEDYGTENETDTCYYAVAVAKAGTAFQFSDLKGKKSCHTGLGKTAGWNVPIGTLLELDLLKWGGGEDEPLERAVANFFVDSCVPGAKGEPTLCSLCKGKGDDKCARSDNEPFYNYNGAFKCLQEVGDVAFVKHTTVPADRAAEFQLLCPGGGRKPVSDFKTCNLGRVPAHAVVTRSAGDKTEAIQECITKAQAKFGVKGASPFHLFSSQFGKDLIFKDSARQLLPLPSSMDNRLFLGSEYYASIQVLRKTGSTTLAKRPKVVWCTLSKAESDKCDTWSAVSEDSIGCVSGASTDDCTLKILRGEADAVTLDGGYAYTAGECGLVPIMGEYYDQDQNTCKKGLSTIGTYKAVAIVKKSNKDISWRTLNGKKSCHTALGRTAGWVIPMGLLGKDIKDCKFDKFFSESCAPGADSSSNLCKLCAGNTGLKGEESKCQASSKELYYGYSGALRCLVEKGDVAFVKHTTMSENADGANSADWTKGLKSEDYELLCLDGSRAPVTEYERCNLATVPAHAVMTRSEKKADVAQVLANQQSLFGRTGTDKDTFQMFVSQGGKDLLFKDSTQCLVPVPAATTTETFLGKDYYKAVAIMKKCTETQGLLAACTFHSCK